MSIAKAVADRFSRFWPGRYFLLLGFPVGAVAGIAVQYALRAAGTPELLALCVAAFVFVAVSFWVGLWKHERELIRGNLDILFWAGLLVATFFIVLFIPLWFIRQGIKALI